MIQPWLERELREALVGYGALLPERINDLCAISLTGLTATLQPKADRVQKLGDELLAAIDKKISSLKSGHEPALEPEEKITRIEEMRGELVSQVNSALEEMDFANRIGAKAGRER